MRGTAQHTMGGGVGAHTEVRVQERPTTNQGLSGMKTGSLGPKRQVYDKSYYLGELRKRCQELSDEIDKMTAESEAVRHDNQVYASLEKRYEQLVKTVRQLEGDLADHNLATDKQRTDTQPEEVHHMYMLMKQQNDEQRQEVDQIFIEKKTHEEEIQRLHQEIVQLARQAEERLNELHPEQHREYEQLREENNQLAVNLAERREENDQISDRLRTLENHLRGDVFRMRATQLADAKKELGAQLEVLEVEARQCSLSMPEQREHLLTKVKTDNAEIVAAEKRIQDLKMENQKLKKDIQEVATDVQTSADMQSDQQKYEILYTKDEEMTQFINNFPKLKEDEEKKMLDKQANIKRLENNIAAAMALAVPPESHMRDVEDELEFKNRQLQNSETTQNRLLAEQQKLQADLNKLEGLDKKVTEAVKQVEGKMKTYQEEISNKFDKVEDMQAMGQEKMKTLAARQTELTEQMEGLKEQGRQLKLKVDSRREQLNDDEVAKALEAQEADIQRYGQTLYTLSSFIRSKRAVSNYEPELISVMDLTAQLNKMHIERRHLPAC